jgi:actin related protein 2/3 complex subunit 3
MPAYHSNYNTENYKLLGNVPVLPLKSKIRGIAPPLPDDQDDIVDEALALFKANTFFRNFDIKGGGDRVLIYLTLYIQECLLKLQKVSIANQAPNTLEANKILQTHAVSNFPLPGDATFPLNSMFERPARQDAGRLNS